MAFFVSSMNRVVADIKAGTRLPNWIDLAHLRNNYLVGVPQNKLDEIYKLTRICDLTTINYLRAMSTTHVEKSTVASALLNGATPAADIGFCAVDDLPRYVNDAWGTVMFVISRCCCTTLNASMGR